MRVTLVISLLLSFLGLQAQVSDYQRIEGKAQRFFDYSEWASANAMYMLMLEKEPSVISTYSHAVVANVMAGDTLQALSLVPKAMSNNIALDSLLTDVKATSFSIGRGDLYENYLLKIKTTYPWLSRVADNYLMQYYAFRRNGPQLVNYARTMLAGLPESRNFLRMLAEGLMLSGDLKGAETTWLRVVSLYPEDYETILDLANYFDAINDREATLNWMRRADTLKKSPYVTARIAALQ